MSARNGIPSNHAPFCANISFLNLLTEVAVLYDQITK